jgi:anti-sigma factor RsiW
MSALPDPEAVVPRHLADEDLLAYLDGELPGEVQREAGLHLERCWDCRTRLAATQDHIEAFMQARASLPCRELQPADRAIASFQHRLAEHATAGSGRRRSPLALLSAARLRALVTSFVPSRPAFALLVLVATATVAGIAWFNAPLSADAMLTRAEIRETRDIRPPDSVVKSIVQIDRVDPSTGRQERLSVETVADSATPAVSVAIETPAGAVHDVLWSPDDVMVAINTQIRFGESLARYVAGRRWIPGVSVVEYRKLILERGMDEAYIDRVDGLVELRHPFRLGHESGLVETRLRLDGRTWIPTTVTLVTTEDGVRREYRLTRMVTEVLVRTSTLAAIFTRPDRTPAPAPSGPPSEARDARRRPLPLAYANSIATPAEVEVAVALHDVGADLGDDINVFQMSDGSLLVQGILDSTARKQQVQVALRAVASPLRAEIESAPNRRSATMELFEPPWRASVAPTLPMPMAGRHPVVRIADLSGAGIPMYERLRASFDGRIDADQAIATFITDLLQRSDGALFHVWALRKLDWQFSERRVQALPPPSLEQIDMLRRAHREALAKTVRDMTAMLTSITERGTQEAEELAGRVEGKQRDTEGMLRLALEQNELVRALFATSATKIDSTNALARLKVLFGELQ